jgi:hypothetical protein
VSCANEVLRHNRGNGSSDIPADELAEGVTIYALSITMETIRRQSDIDMTPPTLENLLSIDRIVDFSKINPEFGRFLKRACIIPDNQSSGVQSWFQRLKQKILSRVAEI